MESSLGRLAKLAKRLLIVSKSLPLFFAKFMVLYSARREKPRRTASEHSKMIGFPVTTISMLSQNGLGIVLL